MTDHVTTHQAEEDARNERILIYVNGRDRAEEPGQDQCL